MENNKKTVVTTEQNQVLSPEEMTAQIIQLKKEIRVLKKKLKEKESGDVQVKQEAGTKERKKVSWIWDVGFYVMIVLILLAVFMFRASAGNQPFSMAGYSAFTVLTSSMEAEIPKGSLVVTKTVDPNTLEIGDDITYMSGPSSTITHRIIGIEENYADTKARGFQTKGIMNKKADKQIVPAANVVGKVVYHNKLLGDIANYLKGNWPYVIFVLIVIVVLANYLKKIYEEDDDEEDNSKKKRKKKKKKRKKKKNVESEEQPKKKVKNKGERTNG